MKMIIMATILSLFGLGCASQAPLYQAVETDRAAVQTATVLLQTNVITKSDAKSLYAGAVATQSALKIWNEGGTSTAALQDLAALAAQLEGLQPKVTARAKATTKPAYKVAAEKRAISPTAVVTLIELAIELTPEIQGWASEVFNQNAPTPAQIDQGFTDLQSALDALATLVN